MWEDVRLWKIVQVGGMVWYHQQHGSGNAKIVAKLWSSLFLFALDHTHILSHVMYICVMPFPSVSRTASVRTPHFFTVQVKSMDFVGRPTAPPSLPHRRRPPTAQRPCLGDTQSVSNLSFSLLARCGSSCGYDRHKQSL